MFDPASINALLPAEFFTDVATVLTLVVLEGLLSADNALVLAVMVRHLPEHQQGRALRYGIIGAFVFRAIGVLLAATLISMWHFKAVGALYLMYLAFKHFLHKWRESRRPQAPPFKLLHDDQFVEFLLAHAREWDPEKNGEESTGPDDPELVEYLKNEIGLNDVQVRQFLHHKRDEIASETAVAQKRWEELHGPVKPKHGFWKTVMLVELADIAFSIDSIVAAVALAPNKLWIVYLGGILGIITMRFVAQYFLSLLKKFPGLENAAYLLVGWIGLKLAVETAYQVFERAAYEEALKNHQHLGIPSWLFWSVMALVFFSGFLVKRKEPS